MSNKKQQSNPRRPIAAGAELKRRGFRHSGVTTAGGGSAADRQRAGGGPEITVYRWSCTGDSR